MEKYRSIVEEQWPIHRINERLEALTSANEFYPASISVTIGLSNVLTLKSKRYSSAGKRDAEISTRLMASTVYLENTGMKR